MVTLFFSVFIFSFLFLSAAGSHAAEMKKLECRQTKIKSITDRFSNPLGKVDSLGTVAVLADVTQSVSYDVVAEIKNSRVNDPVWVCLVFVPEGCPPGDNRGKIYTVTNLRTLKSWTLPDSQHSCGGA